MSGRPTRALWFCVGLFIAAVATRLPFVPERLINWDAVQYALGARQFSVTLHQPHPPGSILYIALARMGTLVLGDTNRALCLLSVLASGAAVVLCYLVGREFAREPVARAAAVLYLASPLTWFYGVVALPYALDGALVLGIVWLTRRAVARRDFGPVLDAAIVLGLSGGVRQTTLPLLLPLWLYTAWRTAGWQLGRLLNAGLLLAAVCAAWLVPLLALSGGPVEYLAASRRLSSLVSSLTSVFQLGVPALVANLAYFVDTLGTSVNLGLLPLLVYAVPRSRPALASEDRRVLALWLTPPVLVFTLLHMGQAGYLLLIFPAACIAVAHASTEAAAWLQSRLVEQRWFARLRGVAAAGGALRPVWRAVARYPAATVVALIAGSGALLFLVSPLSGGDDGGLTRRRIAANDAWLAALAAELRDLPPAEAVLLTGTRSTESFRQVTYYHPAYLVLAVGPDRDGEVGVAFQGEAGVHTYAGFMAGVPAEPAVQLPVGTRHLVLLDDSLADLFAAAALREVPLTQTRSIWLLPVEGDVRESFRLTLPATAVTKR